MSDQEIYRLTTSRTKNVIKAVAILLAVGGVTMGFVVLTPTRDEFDPFFVFFLLTMGVLAAGFWGVIWMYARPKRVVLERDRIWVPGTTFLSPKLYEIDLTELDQVHHWDARQGTFMTLRAGKKTFLLMQSYFRDEATYRSFWASLERRIRATPGGEAMLQASLETTSCNELAFERWRARPTPLAYGAVAVVAAVYVLELISGIVPLEFVPEISAFGMLDMGGFWGPAVAAGEWGRIFTASLLHTSPQHLFYDAIILFIASTVLERSLGSWRTLIILLASCLGGTAAAAIFSPASVLVGTSGGALGLLSAIIYLLIAPRSVLRGALRRTVGFRYLIPLVPIGTALVITGLGISMTTFSVLTLPYGGGVVVGGLITHLLVGSTDARSKVIPAVAIGLAALFVAGTAMTLVRFSTDYGGQTRRVWVLEQKGIADDIIYTI